MARIPARIPPIKAEAQAIRALRPVPQTRGWWTTRRQQKLAQIKKGDVDLVMIGDSITHGWDHVGGVVWDKYYKARKAVNLGYSSDRTEHVIWRLQNGERASLGLTASGVAAGDTALGEVTLEAGGTREQHNASLRVQGPLLDLDLALRGALEGEAWQGRLTSAVLEASGQRWRLRNPTGIRRTADGSVELAAHCWVSGEASLCGSDQRLMPEPRLRYRLRDFQMGSLAELFPDDFAWQGELNVDLILDLPASGPNGTLRIDAGSGVLRMREADTWHDFPYQALALNSRLLPQRIDSELRFDGGELGELTIEARIDPRGETKPHQA